jgi:hypothetical protein
VGEKVMEAYLKLLPEEKEAIDTYAFALNLLERGGDVERRFSLISLDNAFEIFLRAYLLKRGVRREDVDALRKIDDLLWRCEKAGLEISGEEKASLYEMRQKRNQIYHGKMIMLPTKRDLESWSKIIRSLLHKATGVDPLEYFEQKSYERLSIHPTDLEYVANLERNFKRKPPHFSKLTWWSEVQRDVIEAREKWDLYVHYRPRWPFFIPTLILVKCNPYNESISKEYVLDLESKALFLKAEKKVWRVWLGIISSNGFEKDAVMRSEDHEGRALGLVLINPLQKKFYTSQRGECKKALKWLILWGDVNGHAH